MLIFELGTGDFASLALGDAGVAFPLPGGTRDAVRAREELADDPFLLAADTEERERGAGVGWAAVLAVKLVRGFGVGCLSELETRGLHA